MTKEDDVLVSMKPILDINFNHFIENYTVIKFLYNISYFVYYYMVVYPFSRLYLNGPGRWGFGFWNGQSIEDICFQLSGNRGPRTLHYVSNTEECLNMIEKDFRSNLVFVEVVILYPILLWLFFKMLFCIIKKMSASK